ncbi:MAG: N-acetylglutamate synthase-like GNAT family acetyltransferase [Rhodothermales bacterium]|jgi:N-acetylglutamate synthase-like GNAT family acetyltransferase
MISDLSIKNGLEGLTPGRIITMYRRAPLLRAVDTPERVWKKFESSDIVITAWHGEQLAGIARALSDGVAQSFLCELAVEPDVQGSGVGRLLLDRIFERCKGTELVLRHSSISSRYYQKLGFERVENGWVRNC